jgi:hypothetical protein
MYLYKVFLPLQKPHTPLPAKPKQVAALLKKKEDDKE